MSEAIFEHACSGGQVIRLVHGDLTEERVDAIVNAANEFLMHGGGVAGAIVRKGGLCIQDQSTRWVEAHGTVSIGGVAMTGSGKLPCKSVIHAVGPVWKDGKHDEARLLRSAVWKSLELANEQKFISIAIRSISSGIFGFPKDRCAKIMVQSAIDFCDKHPDSAVREIRFTIIDQVTLDVFEREFEERFGQV